jgi:hypothetical protein
MSEDLQKLLSLDVSEYTEQREGLTYLSWANAWKEFLKVYPSATYDIKKNDNGQCWFGDENIGYMVYTTVTADGITREMWLPVLDMKHKPLKLNPYTYKTKYGEKEVDAINSFDINKAVMRCLTKNLAMFGLGLYIYAGEDLPEEDTISSTEAKDFSERLIAAGKSEDDILKWAKIKKLTDLPRSKYEVLIKKV